RHVTDDDAYRDRPVAVHRRAAKPSPTFARMGAAARRLRKVPVESAKTTGRAVLMAASVIRFVIQDAITLQLPVGETVHQCWSRYKVTALPALLMAIPFGGMVAVQSSGLINQVGAASIVGAASGVGVVRQGAPLTAGLLMGGAAASAIASDLGARAIREGLDAFRVVGGGPGRYLCRPRFPSPIIPPPLLV